MDNRRNPESSTRGNGHERRHSRPALRSEEGRGALRPPMMDRNPSMWRKQSRTRPNVRWKAVDRQIR